MEDVGVVDLRSHLRPFALTPALSPRERENKRPRCELLEPLDISTDGWRDTLSPGERGNGLHAPSMTTASLSLCLLVLLFLVPPLATASAAETVRAMRFQAQTPAEARAWQEAARAKLFALLMGGGQPERGPLDVKVLRTIEVPASRAVLEELTLQTLPDRRAHVWLARPTQPKGKVGAVLALHGHGGSGEQIVNGTSLYWYGRALVERGYVVISPDIGQHDLQHTNWTLMGERTWDALRCLDYVVTLPEVDSTRLAVAGLSLGGETTMYVAALDERLKLACSSGWLTTIANMKNGHCVCYNSPGWRRTSSSRTSSPALRLGRWCVNWARRRGRPAVFLCRLAGRPLRKSAPPTASLTPSPISRSPSTLARTSSMATISGRCCALTLGAPASAASGIPPANEAFPEMRKAWDTEGRLPASTDQRRAAPSALPPGREERPPRQRSLLPLPPLH